MSTLSRRLKQPQTWLMLFGSLVLLGVLDSFRAPDRQWTGQLYIAAVHLYQQEGRPLLKGRVECRFTPSCSDYSLEAVQRHGIRRGLVLTVERLSRCNHDTPLGTSDPVPPEEENHESHE
jgi:putative membrane protein insertion efficiency factor